MEGMDDYRPFYRDPIKQIYIAIFFVFVLYIYLMGRQGSAVDVAYRDGYAYVAMGASWGVGVVDVRNPGSPGEVGHYSFLGTAQGVTLAGNYLLVADGVSGMRILDISNPQAPLLVSSFSTPGNTRDIAVAGHFAYLAKGAAGLTDRRFLRSGPSSGCEKHWLTWLFQCLASFTGIHLSAAALERRGPYREINHVSLCRQRHARPAGD